MGRVSNPMCEGRDCWELSHIVRERGILLVNKLLVNFISMTTFRMCLKTNPCGFGLKRTIS